MSVSLYFHIPFCKIKCIYCDFYSVVNRDEHIPLFVQSLIDEFKSAPPDSSAYADVETIYLGGGTPSMLSGRQVSELLESIHDVIPIRGDAEITLEANPGEVDFARLKAYREAGVNRVSFGLQSFDNSQLERLGRLHRSHQNPEAIEMAREAEFENISVDLIFHLPQQSLADFKNDLRQMLALQPEHISVYSLTVEPRTPLFQYVQDGRIEMTSDDLDAAMYRHLCEKTSDAGFAHYEVSNFGLPGFRSIHNSNYWNGSHYYSYGPSSHSFNGDERWWNVRDLSEYFTRMQHGKSPVEEREVLTSIQKREEFLLTRLRAAAGVSISEWEGEFNERFPISLSEFFKNLSEEHENWIWFQDGSWRLTEEGLLFNDSIVYDALNALTSEEEVISEHTSSVNSLS